MSFLTRTNAIHHCRTCLTYLGISGENEPMILRYHLKMENLAEWIENLASLRVLAFSDDYPQFICGGCYKKLKEFNNYHLMVRQAAEELSALLENPQSDPSENMNILHINLSENTMKLRDEKNDELDIEMEEEFISLKVNVEKEPTNALQTNCTNNANAKILSELQCGIINTNSNIEMEYDTSIIPKADINGSNRSNKSNQTSKAQSDYSHERPFGCQFCPKRLKQKWHLKTHEKLHTDEKPYSCEMCSKRFRRLDHLNKHRKIHRTNFIEKNENFKVKSKKSQSKSLQNEAPEVNLDGVLTAKIHFVNSNEVKIKYEFERSHKEFINESLYKQPDESKTIGTFNNNVVSSVPSPLEEVYDDSNLKETKISTSVMQQNTSNSKLWKEKISKNNAMSMIKNYQCDTCLKSFSRTDTLKTHIASKHNGIRRYACQICHKSFDFKLSLLRHKVIHTERKSFTCDICDRKFALSHNFRKHRRKHMKNPDFLKKLESQVTSSGKNNAIPNMKVIHLCHICQKNFSYKCRLQAHILTAHKGVRRFVCQICNLNLSSKYYLKEHERIHTGEKPFACDICDCRFRRHQTLRKHRKKHWQPLPEGDNFMKKKARTKLTIFSSPDTSRPFVCQYCRLSFSHKHHLKTHERIHTGEKPYVCVICNKSFTQSGSLHRHTRIHTEESTSEITDLNLVK